MFRTYLGSGKAKSRGTATGQDLVFDDMPMSTLALPKGTLTLGCEVEKISIFPSDYGLEQLDREATGSIEFAFQSEL